MSDPEQALGDLDGVNACPARCTDDRDAALCVGGRGQPVEEAVLAESRHDGYEDERDRGGLLEAELRREGKDAGMVGVGLDLDVRGERRVGRARVEEEAEHWRAWLEERVRLEGFRANFTHDSSLRDGRKS